VRFYTARLLLIAFFFGVTAACTPRSEFEGAGVPMPPSCASNPGLCQEEVKVTVGTGEFTKSSFSPVLGEETRYVATGDFNGNGYRDLAVSSLASNQVFVYLYGEDNGFEQAAGSPIQLDAGCSPRGLASDDLTENGYGDLVVVCGASSKLELIQSLGNGQFQRNFWTAQGGQDPRHIQIADMTGNGNLDLTFSYRGNGSTAGEIEVFVGNGFGNFSSHSKKTIGGAGNLLQKIRLADVNGNGHLDVIGVLQNTDKVVVVTNNGAGGLLSDQDYSTGGLTSPRSLVVGPVVGNDAPDIAVVHIGNSEAIGSGLSLLAWNPTGSHLNFQEDHVSNPLVGYRDIDMGDFNNNGRLDLAVVTYGLPDSNDQCTSGTEGRVLIFTQDESGSYQMTSSYPSGCGARSIVVDDLTGNGVLDIASISEFDNRLHLFEAVTQKISIN